MPPPSTPNTINKTSQLRNLKRLQKAKAYKSSIIIDKHLKLEADKAERKRIDEDFSLRFIRDRAEFNAMKSKIISQVSINSSSPHLWSKELRELAFSEEPIKTRSPTPKRLSKPSSPNYRSSYPISFAPSSSSPHSTRTTKRVDSRITDQERRQKEERLELQNVELNVNIPINEKEGHHSSYTNDDDDDEDDNSDNDPASPLHQMNPSLQKFFTYERAAQQPKSILRNSSSRESSSNSSINSRGSPVFDEPMARNLTTRGSPIPFSEPLLAPPYQSEKLKLINGVVGSDGKISFDSVSDAENCESLRILVLGNESELKLKNKATRQQSKHEIDSHQNLSVSEWELLAQQAVLNSEEGGSIDSARESKRRIVKGERIAFVNSPPSHPEDRPLTKLEQQQRKRVIEENERNDVLKHYWQKRDKLQHESIMDPVDPSNPLHDDSLISEFSYYERKIEMPKSVKELKDIRVKRDKNYKLPSVSRNGKLSRKTNANLKNFESKQSGRRERLTLERNLVGGLSESEKRLRKGAPRSGQLNIQRISGIGEGEDLSALLDWGRSDEFYDISKGQGYDDSLQHPERSLTSDGGLENRGEKLPPSGWYQGQPKTPNNMSVNTHDDGPDILTILSAKAGLLTRKRLAHLSILKDQKARELLELIKDEAVEENRRMEEEGWCDHQSRLARLRVKHGRERDERKRIIRHVREESEMILVGGMAKLGLIR